MLAEHKNLLDQLGVDLDVTMERFVGNEDLYIRCLRKLLTDTNYVTMLDAIEKNDVKGAFEASHALKGVTANLGLDCLFKELQEITEVFRADRLDYDPDNMVRLKNQFDKAVLTIEKL